MSGFHFKRLNKYKTGGTKDNMELSIPLPKTETGKVYRYCPNEKCSPRLFLIGTSQATTFDSSKTRRAPGSRLTTCPYCGIDAEDSKFNYQGDIEAIKKYIGWAALKDAADAISKVGNVFNKSFKPGNFISMKMETKTNTNPEPKFWREDLIRNLSCSICSRPYGVYAVALFCPDCGGKNLSIHFEREIELILQQVDIADNVRDTGNIELYYRILGNAHEDVVTVFETYQKVFYKYMVLKAFPAEKAKALISKNSIGNKFQNVDRATDLYRNLSIDPFTVFSSKDLKLLKRNIDKRHIIGHNLSMIDDSYINNNTELPGVTVDIVADEIIEFSQTVKCFVCELERLMPDNKSQNGT